MNEHFKLVATWLYAGLIGAGLTMSWLVYYLDLPKYKDRFEQTAVEADKMLVSVKRVVALYSSSYDRVSDSVAVTVSKLEALRDRVDQVTGTEVQRRIEQLRSRVGVIDAQVASLQQIISPANASEILTVARMREEILARQKFENRAGDDIKLATARVESLQQWLVGFLVSVIGSLLGVMWLLLKRTSTLYHLMQSIQHETEESEPKQNERSGR